MKPWYKLNTVEIFNMIESCESSFHKSEDTLTRLNYVKTIYNLIYKKHLEEKEHER